MAPLEDSTDKLLVLYDGVCGLCQKSVRFILARDHKDRFRFAALQSDGSRALLARHGRDPDLLETMVVVQGAGTDRERITIKGRAGLKIMRNLGGLWPLTAVFAIIPTFIMNWVYDRVARTRYQRHGKLEACPVPPPEHRAKFVDAA